MFNIYLTEKCLLQMFKIDNSIITSKAMSTYDFSDLKF